VTVTVTASQTPTVTIDAPTLNSSVSGIVLVGGWAIDNKFAVGTAINGSSLQVMVDGNVVGNAIYGVSRPDVCNAFPVRPGCPNVGFNYWLNTTSLANGPHSITVSATDSDGSPDTGSNSVIVRVGPPLSFI